MAEAEVRVGMVGTREPGAESLAAMESLASQLAQSGAVIVSGAARGTDMAAHRGALSAGGGTIACVPQGLRQLPFKWRSEFEKLQETDLLLLVSPFAPNQKLTRQTPPLRNRLIASFSQALIVGEAGLTSGTHICLNFARKLGRPIFFLRAEKDGDPQILKAQEGLAASGAVGFTRDQAFDAALVRTIIAAANKFQQSAAKADAAQLKLFDS